MEHLIPTLSKGSSHLQGVEAFNFLENEKTGQIVVQPSFLLILKKDIKRNFYSHCYGGPIQYLFRLELN